MIIDCHGHFTTAPAAHQEFRAAQLAGRSPAPAAISDDDVREAIEPNQLRVLRERGGDLMLFSPRAAARGEHVPDPALARARARACNDLVHRVTVLSPANFAGVCQLPQTPGGSIDDSVAELLPCVEELGFVGCNLTPDPSCGDFSSPPLAEPFWLPLFETMVICDVPAM